MATLFVRMHVRRMAITAPSIYGESNTTDGVGKIRGFAVVEQVYAALTRKR